MGLLPPEFVRPVFAHVEKATRPSSFAPHCVRTSTTQHALRKNPLAVDSPGCPGQCPEHAQGRGDPTTCGGDVPEGYHVSVPELLFAETETYQLGLSMCLSTRRMACPTTVKLP